MEPMNPLAPDFHLQEYIITSSSDVIDRDGKEMLSCSARTVKHLFK